MAEPQKKKRPFISVNGVGIDESMQAAHAQDADPSGTPIWGDADTAVVRRDANYVPTTDPNRYVTEQGNQGVAVAPPKMPSAIAKPAPSQPVAPNKPVATPAAASPMFTNMPSVAAERGLTIDAGNGIMGNRENPKKGSFTVVPEGANVRVLPGGAGFAAGVPVEQSAAGQKAREQTAAGPLGQPRSMEQVLAGIDTPDTAYGAMLALRLASGISNQENRQFNANRELDLKQQGIEAESPLRAAQARQAEAQASAAEYAISDDAKKAEAAKLQREGDQKDAETYQKYYSDALTSMKDNLTLTAEQKAEQAAKMARQAVDTQREQAAIAKMTPEQKAALAKKNLATLKAGVIKKQQDARAQFDAGKISQEEYNRIWDEANNLLARYQS